MEVSYYPGCSLHGMAAQYDESIRAACEALGIVLAELPDWNCCGSTSAHVLDDGLAAGLSARNVEIARCEGRELVVPCAACFQRLKRAEKQVGGRWHVACGEENENTFQGGNTDPHIPPATYHLPPSLPITHLTDFLHRPEWIQALKQKLRRPLAGLSGAAYYGCLSQRPPEVTGARTPENPTAMDDLLRALGMDVRPWSYKTDCCGGSLAVARGDLVRKLSGDLFEAAAEAGAECVVTDCPMCQSNLDTRQAQIEVQRGREFAMPVFYVTELMALALGDARAARWWKKHFVDPRPLLKRKGLL